MLELPRVELLESTTSTLDVAHRLAARGAPAGTLVIANEQTAGRGRGGKSWQSSPGAGLWLTLIERPSDSSGLGVLSLRVGLAAAEALDRFAPEPIRLKWPNDLYIDQGKLGGILVEARWREQAVEWVAIGLGVNVRAPTNVETAAGLEPGTDRLDVLGDLIPAVLAASRATGPLQADEMEEFDARDLARGRRCVEPAVGRVAGISPTGELLVALADSVVPFRSGSLVLEDPQ
ncbi:MAG TPA: biotin--[acetyl-CoA-carboxylase] ligase [Gemmatimonadetes bacterium]|jgi:BirA family biotin operon repressor/biotin-[acetyl-CoA-carboxylase] ligase|nr:biotin--[acetyl-CoA-carboxylase] ligase [Gemmatimonadota bacterium]